jgi:hypothetical protein
MLEDIATILVLCLVVGICAGFLDTLFGPGPFDRDELGRWKR